MEFLEGFSGQNVRIENITEAVKQMPGTRGFLTELEGGEVRPFYAKEIKVAYLLMNWPFLGSREEQESGISLYAAVMEHGKTHVAEVFFADEASGKYLGSHMAFSIEFPGNFYQADYDPWLMEELSSKVLGAHREKTVGHDFLSILTGKAE